jgi:hypothetical protein
VVTAAPTITPAAPPLPSTTTVALPSAYNVSSLDLLNEQMQLSYEIINLQLLLQGSMDDDYTKSGFGKRHVTLGFPISITTPQGHEGEVAEVEVSVCNVKDSASGEPPSLRTIIPREKTYNTANIVSDSSQLGIGAVIGNIINVGASFLSGHQTYYLVRDQDTVALQRGARATVKCQVKESDPAIERPPPVTFAWQFRPVLGEKSVQQGLRQTFAQVSIDPISEGDLGTFTVITQTCWRQYDRKNGIVGKTDFCGQAKTSSVQSFYNTLTMYGVTQTDNGDGTITAKVTGTFPSGTRVGLGDASVNETSVGFENTGRFIRFSAPTQLVATRGARLITPDGLESDVVASSFFSSDPKMPTDVTVHGDFDDIDKARVEGGGLVNFDRRGNAVTLHLPNSDLSKTMNKIKFLKHDGSERSAPKMSTDVTVHGNFDDIVAAHIEGIGKVDFDRKGYGVTLHLPAGDFSDTMNKIKFVRRGGSECKLPNETPPQELHATTKPYSDSLVEVVVPIWQCMEVHPDGGDKGNFAPIVVVGGRAFGLSDAPFNRTSPTALSFLAPRALIQGQTKLKLKRLFLDSSYESTYALKPMSGLSVDGISILEVSSKGVTFAVTGSQLAKSKLRYPTPVSVDSSDPAFLKFTLTQEQVASAKQIVLASAGEMPVVYPLPTVPKASSDNATKISILDTAKENGTTYAVAGAGLKNAKIVFPTLATPADTSDTYMKFQLSATQANTVKEVVIQPAKANSDPIVVALPSAKTDDTAKTTATLTPDDGGVTKGSSAPYTIKGTNLQHVVQLRFENTQVLFSYGAGGTSITIPQLPAQSVAQTGSFPIEVRMDDGTKQYFTLVVK